MLAGGVGGARRPRVVESRGIAIGYFAFRSYTQSIDMKSTRGHAITHKRASTNFIRARPESAQYALWHPRCADTRDPAHYPTSDRLSAPLSTPSVIARA